MRFRSTLAMLTAFVLLTIACATSVCETTCLAGSLTSMCRHAAAPLAASATAMADCGMAALSAATSPIAAHELKAHRADALSAEPTSDCNGRLCEQPQTMLFDQDSTSLEHMVGAGTVTLPVLLHFPRQAVVVKPQRPPLRASLLISLQSILRV